MSNDLPVHPFTGVRAIGVGKRGPIWPVMGGAPDDDDSRDDGPTLTHSQAVNRLHDIRSELTRLTELDEMSNEDESYFRQLTDEFDTVDKHRKKLERRHALARIERADDGVDQSLRGLRIVPGTTKGGGGGDTFDRDSILEPDSVENGRYKDPWNMNEMRTYGREPGAVAGEYRSRALAAIERMQGCSDNIRKAATHIIEEYDTKDARLSRHALVTSQPAYLRAWSKLACGKSHSITPDEQRAISEVEEFRAMSLSDAQGGYLVPFQLDPTLIITSSGVRSDIRQKARTVIATGDVWNGVSSANVSWSFDPEATEVSDDSPSFAGPAIPNYMARGFVPISIEALMDEQNVAQQVGRLLAGGKDELEGNKLIVGSGTNEPTGLITALVAAGGSTVVAAGVDNTFALSDVYALQGSLPARFRQNASWLANNLVYNRIRQFDTAGGAGLWTTLAYDRPPQLLGRDALEAEAMAGLTGSVTGTNYALAFGDFENFVITDRLGMAVEFIPHLVGANRRPTGQRGWFAYYRVGSGVVNANAFRLLNV
jgi:HK97 family phage major capsid protein